LQCDVSPTRWVAFRSLQARLNLMLRALVLIAALLADAVGESGHRHSRTAYPGSTGVELRVRAFGVDGVGFINPQFTGLIRSRQHLFYSVPPRPFIVSAQSVCQSSRSQPRQPQAAFRCRGHIPRRAAVRTNRANRIHKVLFLWTGNSVRSILAESLLNHWGHARIRAFSAGRFPKRQVHEPSSCSSAECADKRTFAARVRG